MSQTKYKLPDDLKVTCINLVRGYERRVLQYHNRRNEVLYSSSAPPDGQPRGSGTSNETLSKTQQLEYIETLFDSCAIKAVEQAKIAIGEDMADEPRRNLQTAIWDSCVMGKNFRLGHYDLAMGSNNFYERRRRFLHKIADLMGFLDRL